MSKIRMILVTVTSALILTGCVRSNNPLGLIRQSPDIRTSMVHALSLEVQPRAENCYLDIILDRNPERPFVVLGRISALYTAQDEAGLAATETDVIPHIREKACQSGGHVLFKMRSHFQDHWLTSVSGSPDQDGSFVRTIRSTALVGVYVARNGSVLTAPSGSRTVIRVPTPLDRPSVTVDGGDSEMSWDQGITDPWAVPAP